MYAVDFIILVSGPRVDTGSVSAWTLTTQGYLTIVQSSFKYWFFQAQLFPLALP
jgi:hypothetical protein